jgi:hypothetical protein
MWAAALLGSAILISMVCTVLRLVWRQSRLAIGPINPGVFTDIYRQGLAASDPARSTLPKWHRVMESFILLRPGCVNQFDDFAQ